MQVKSFLFLSAIVILASCSKSSSDTNSPASGGNSGANPGPMFTSVKAVLQANCAVSGCHAGSSPQNGINFTDNATILAQKDRIKVRAVDQAGTPSQMPQPPRAPLSSADQSKITDWIAAGGGLAN